MEVKEGRPKDSFHYIPILESLKILVEDETFQRNLTPHEDGSELLRDVKDGFVYRNSEFFTQNPEALCLLLYSDAVEVTNPLSFGKGKHKIVQLYWQVADIARFQRSNVNRIQLGLVFKEKLLRKYSFSQIASNFIGDLLVLEQEGVEVETPFKRSVKAGVLLYSGDNLGIVSNNNLNFCIHALNF